MDDNQYQSERPHHYRSFFWPIILIGVGVLWLLANLGYVHSANLVQLWRLWPLLLIVAGLDILLGRRAPLIGALMGLIVVGAVGFFLLSNSPLPGVSAVEVKTEHLTLPVEQARRANVRLDFWSDPVKVFAASDPQMLVDAEITHSGQLSFSGAGQEEKTVRLSHQSVFTPGVWFDSSNNRADVGLGTQIPLDLTINTHSGSSVLDLSHLQLSHLDIESGSGSVQLTLPASPQNYLASLHSASGSLRVTIPEGTNTTLELDSGSGSVNVNLPANTGLRIEVRDTGSGSLNLPGGLTQVSGNSRDEGAWESPDFSSAQNRVIITVTSRGSGSMNFSD